MVDAFYSKAGSLISPGDIFDRLPYGRVPKPLRIARKFPGSLPKNVSVKGELREILEYGRDDINPNPNFNPPGEDVLVSVKMAKAMFLTWGSEVEDDQRSGNLHKKEWLIAPVFSLGELKGAGFTNSKTGEQINIVDAIKAGKSPKYFPLHPFPGETETAGYYVDFKRICSVVATHFTAAPRHWRLSAPALNDFYHQLIWFFTRREIFFRAIECRACGNPVDLGMIFEGQALEPE